MINYLLKIMAVFTMALAILVIFIILPSKNVNTVYGNTSYPTNEKIITTFWKPVTITTYFSDPKQCYGDYTITGDGSKITKNSTNWCAVSHDILSMVSYGDSIRVIAGDPLYDGIYIVHDAMNPRVNNCIDILIPPGSKKRGGLWKGKWIKL